MSSSGARLVLLGVVAAYAVGLLLLGLYLVREVLALVFIAWVLAAAMRPPVDVLSRRLPRTLAIAIVYLLALLVLVNLALLVVPPLVAQFLQLAQQFPDYLAVVQGWVEFLQAWLAQYGLALGPGETLQQALRFTGEAAGGLIVLLFVPLTALHVAFATITVLVLSFYWLLQRDRALDWLTSFLSSASEARARFMFDQAEAQMGAYVQGLAVLALSVGGLSLVGLAVLGVPFALALAMIAGLLELLPLVGPFLSAIPAILVAATQSPWLALATAGLFVVVQQVENYVLVPKVQEKAVGLSPLVTLLAVLVGASLAGFIGALLAVPTAALLNLLIEHWRQLHLARSRRLLEREEQQG
ncbi:MAG: AI-2E family transporter [Chloroflexi bacterium]|nr:AI-2E family transporter [Chloroflexota bacterium]